LFSLVKINGGKMKEIKFKFSLVYQDQETGVTYANPHLFGLVGEATIGVASIDPELKQLYLYITDKASMFAQATEQEIKEVFRQELKKRLLEQIEKIFSAE